MKGAIHWQTDGDWPHALPELVIDPRRTALLIVDMQNYSSNNQGALSACGQLRDFFHRHHLEVIYLRVGSLLPDRRDMHAKRALAWSRPSPDEPPQDVSKGTHNFDIRDALTPLPGELVIDKNSSGAFNSSPLDQYLHALEVQNLVMCGSATSRCVDGTARGAADRGYNVILAEDACIDHSDRNHRTTMHTFARVFGAVKSTTQAIAELQALLDPHLASTPARG